MTANTVEALKIIEALTVPHAELVKAEELEALENEGMARISEEGFELLKRYKEINKEEDVLKKEKEAIKSLLRETELKGVKALTYGGRVVVAETPTKTTKTNVTGLRKDHPEIAAKYVTTTETTKFDVKAL